MDIAGTGPLIIFLHGNGLSRIGWHDEIADFAGRFTATAWDAPGHGDSDDYDGPYRFADVCDDLVRVLNRLSADRAHLIGHSMGGRVVLEFQNRFPNRVKSVVFAGMSARREPPLPPAELSIRSARRNRSPTPGPGQHPPLSGKGRIGGGVRARGRTARRGTARILREDIGTVVSHTDFPPFETVKAPYLVLTGAENLQATPDYAREIAEQIAGARLAVIPGAGHMVNMEQSAAFSAAVLAFFAGTASAKPLDVRPIEIRPATADL